MPMRIASTVCTIYSAVRAVSRDASASLLASQLVRLGVLFSAITLYEGARHSKCDSTTARKSSYNAGPVVLLVAQVATGAVALPAYFLRLCLRSDAGKGQQDVTSSRPPTEHIWTVASSILGCFVLPLIYAQRTGWNNTSISLTMAYPLLLMGTSWFLPPVFRNLISPNNSLFSIPSLPILIVAAAAILASITGHVQLLGSNLPLSSIFAFHGGDDIVGILHRMCAADFIICSAALASWVITHLPEVSFKSRIAAVVKVVAGSVVAGPSAAIAVLWASRELRLSSDSSSESSRSVSEERQRLIAAGRGL